MQTPKLPSLMAYYSGRAVNVGDVLDHHLQATGDKHAADKQFRFHIACARVLDNAKEGYVIEGETVFFLSGASRKALILRGEARDKALVEIAKIEGR